MDLDSSDTDRTSVIAREHTPALLTSYAWFFTPVHLFHPSAVHDNFVVFFVLHARTSILVFLVARLDGRLLACVPLKLQLISHAIRLGPSPSTRAKNYEFEYQSPYDVAMNTYCS